MASGLQSCHLLVTRLDAHEQLQTWMTDQTQMKHLGPSGWDLGLHCCLIWPPAACAAPSSFPGVPRFAAALGMMGLILLQLPLQKRSEAVRAGPMRLTGSQSWLDCREQHAGAPDLLPNLLSEEHGWHAQCRDWHAGYWNLSLNGAEESQPEEAQLRRGEVAAQLQLLGRPVHLRGSAVAHHGRALLRAQGGWA